MARLTTDLRRQDRQNRQPRVTSLQTQNRQTRVTAPAPSTTTVVGCS